MQIRHALAIMLLFSSLLLPIVSSQSYVTITTQLTSMQVTTYTAGSSVTTSLSQPQQLIDRPFRVNSTTGTNAGCETFSLTFNGTQGQYVSGNFTSDIPLAFIITQDSPYQNWLKSGGCASLPPSIVSQLPTTSYGFNVALPGSGLWDIVLVNYSNSRDADGFMVAYLSLLGYTITGPLLNTITLTSLVQSMMTEQVSAPTDYSYYLIAGLIIVVIIVVALTAIRVMRRKTNSVQAERQTTP